MEGKKKRKKEKKTDFHINNLASSFQPLTQNSPENKTKQKKDRKSRVQHGRLKTEQSRATLPETASVHVNTIQQTQSTTVRIQVSWGTLSLFVLNLFLNSLDVD